jgi:hypothetical protein
MVRIIWADYSAGMRRALGLSLFVVLTACAAQTPQPVDPAEVAIDLPEVALDLSLAPEDITTIVAFLADDAQAGRAPGSEADARVQAFITEHMTAAGLEPGGSVGFAQPFVVGDGARLREGASSALLGPRDESVEHALLPFGHDTGEVPVEGKLVFVGHGVVGEGEDPGDFAGLDAALEGAIAVALVGSADPHTDPAKTRPQSKLIAARDRGAVGFVLWDPESDTPWPNHGAFGEMGIPAVFVGKSGTPAMRKALRVRGESRAKLGARSRVALRLQTPIEAVELETANLIGVLEGSAPAESRERIYLGAHMDHLGMGTSTSLAPGERAVHNGADDNASGVAVLLELAEALAEVPASRRPHDLVFVAFGAEEMGTLGSKHLVEQLSPEERERILAMLNFDMVGRLREHLLVNGRGTAKEWEGMIEAANADLGLSLEGVVEGWGPSDHAVFYAETIPVLHFFTGPHDDYHKPSDDIDKLDADGAARIGELAGEIVLELMAEEGPLSYVETERPSEGRKTFRVSLGTMPDYGKQVDGLALAGVREGSSAAEAGLHKGDVITRIGAREIHNIDDFMACFGELEPGVEVELVFLRDGDEHTTKMVPAAPRPH